jgi:predicted dehydrogenase
MIRLAISGAGAIAERAHTPAFLSVPEIHIVALQSRTIEKAERVASAVNSGATPRIYRDYDGMLRSEHPDAVGIFTPNALHCEFTLKAMAAGAHVLVEKPMAPTVAEARKMVEAARSAGRVLMVAMQRRFGGLEGAIKRAIDGGAIGTPHFIRSRLSHGGPETWRPARIGSSSAPMRGLARCSISECMSPIWRDGFWVKSNQSLDRSRRSEKISRSRTTASRC